MKSLVVVKLLNDNIIVSTDIAVMIIRKYEQCVLQSLCSISQDVLDFLDVLDSIYAIHIQWKCAMQNKTNAKKKKIYIYIYNL